jgi:hypothetical protein
MSPVEPRYEVVIIGTGASGQEAVAALAEKGIHALLIELTPQTVATLVSQTPQQALKDDAPSSQSTESFRIGDANQPVRLFSHIVHTPAGRIATYTFHGQPLPEKEVDKEVSPVEFTFEADPAVRNGEDEVEVLEAQQVEYASPHHSLSERERPYTGNMRSSASRFSFEKASFDVEKNYPVYSFERVNFEEEEDHGNIKDWTHSDSHERPDSRGETTAEEATDLPPVYLERELKLRKRLIGSHRKLRIAEAQTEPKSPFQPSGSAHSSSPDLHPPEAPSFRQWVQAQENDTQHQKNEGTGFEPFSARRRSRSQKKSRLQSKGIFYAEVRPKKSKKPMWEEEPSFEEQTSSFAYDPGMFENGRPMLQPFSQEWEEKSSQSDTSSGDALKRDNIEFVDAYGDYSSWEDFLTPLSQNKRKRQELDKIEKRKIALRGLHNLINNLG